MIPLDPFGSMLVWPTTALLRKRLIRSSNVKNVKSTTMSFCKSLLSVLWIPFFVFFISWRGRIDGWFALVSAASLTAARRADDNDTEKGSIKTATPKSNKLERARNGKQYFPNYTFKILHRFIKR